VIRGTFTACAVLSTLILIGVCTLWVRGHRGADDVASAVWNANRYTVRSEPGRLTLYGPPPMPQAGTWVWAVKGKTDEAVPPPDDFAAQIRNADAVVSLIRRSAVRWTPVVGPLDRRRGAYGELSRCGGYRYAYRREALAPCLLRALEDPGRAVAAHTLLAAQYPPHGLRVTPTGGGSFRYDANGLNVDLRLTGQTYESAGPPLELCEATFDVSAIPALRDQWHRRLDVPVRTASHHVLAPAAAAMPSAWLMTCVLRIRRARARQIAHRCGACGYDLRATPGRCPECGTVAAPAPTLA
jgi:hypothetical protein